MSDAARTELLRSRAPSMGTAAIRVLVVDAAVLWRSTVRDSVSGSSIEVVGEAATPERAVQLAVESRPEVVIVDARLAKSTNYELVRDLTVRVPGCKIILFADVADHGEAVRGLARGAIGYLTKSVSRYGLVRAILGTREGALPMSRQLAATALRHFVNVARDAPSFAVEDGSLTLTGREAEILGKMADGMTDRQIADALSISPRTVESHVRSVLRKLGVQNRAGATRRFMVSGAAGVGRSPSPLA